MVGSRVTTHGLTRLLPALAAAALLCGVKDTDRDTVLLRLAVDDAGKHRRKGLAGLEPHGRTQRPMGSARRARLRHPPANLDTFENYRPPGRHPGRSPSS